jgi:3',5'-cyclic-AMP phosphodiesterase
VFVHHALFERDLTDDYWFTAEPDAIYFAANASAVREVLASSANVQAVFNGHLHGNHVGVEHGIPYFSILSLVENPEGDGKPSGSYAVVDVNGRRIKVKVKGRYPAEYELPVRGLR